MIVTKGMGDLQDTLATIQTWTPMDWTIAVGGAYILWSLMFTTHHHYGVAKSKIGKL